MALGVATRATDLGNRRRVAQCMGAAAAAITTAVTIVSMRMDGMVEAARVQSLVDHLELLHDRLE